MVEADAQRFDRLSPRMRECLRLVYSRNSNKEIALLLSTPERPISDGTVGGYIAEAIKILGARNRRHAAEQLHAHEDAPTNLQGPDCGVAQAAPSPPQTPSPMPPSWLEAVPFRLTGARDNDLSIIQRALWVPAITIAIAIGFGMLAAGLHVVSDLVRR